MISVDEALQHMRRCSQQLAAQSVPLGEALGLQLAEDVVSGVDSPPFDKSMLDGYAVEASDQSSTRRVIEQVVAGGVPHHAVEPGTTINIMTGAPLPDGADAVVKVEDVTHPDETTIEMPSGGISAGTGILRRGVAFHRGEQLLAAGRRLSAVDIALLAEIGLAKVSVVPRPRVAVLSTGSELVEIGQKVGPGQICNSNGPMLVAMLESVSATAIDLGIGLDDTYELKRLVTKGLEADILIVTGGVSAGVLDLVPGVLQELGVEQVFHKIRMKPGKPLWFGAKQQADSQSLVFGMPGNPVSTLVAFEVFVKPTLSALRGEGFSPPKQIHGVLTGPVTHRSQRPTYYPCRMSHSVREQGLPTIEPLPWSGSADLAALTRANALAMLPEGNYQLEAGAEVDAISL